MMLKHIRDDACGTVLVEAAITLPLFILMLFSLIELGLLMWTQAGLQHGAEMAARYATTYQAANAGSNPSNSTVQTYAANNSLGLSFSSNPYTYSPPGGDCPAGNRVTASYSFPLFGIYTLSTASWTLAARSCFPIPS